MDADEISLETRRMLNELRMYEDPNTIEGNLNDGRNFEEILANTTAVKDCTPDYDIADRVRQFSVTTKHPYSKERVSWAQTEAAKKSGRLPYEAKQPVRNEQENYKPRMQRPTVLPTTNRIYGLGKVVPTAAPKSGNSNNGSVPTSPLSSKSSSAYSSYSSMGQQTNGHDSSDSITLKSQGRNVDSSTTLTPIHENFIINSNARATGPFSPPPVKVSAINRSEKVANLASLPAGERKYYQDLFDNFDREYEILSNEASPEPPAAPRFRHDSTQSEPVYFDMVGASDSRQKRVTSLLDEFRRASHYATSPQQRPQSRGLRRFDEHLLAMGRSLKSPPIAPRRDSIEKMSRAVRSPLLSPVSFRSPTPPEGRKVVEYRDKMYQKQPAVEAQEQQKNQAANIKQQQQLQQQSDAKSVKVNGKQKNSPSSGNPTVRPAMSSLINRPVNGSPVGGYCYPKPDEIQAKVRALTDQAEQELRKKQIVYGVCQQCNNPITEEVEACQALGKLYHSHCFRCTQCDRSLRGRSFYNVNGQIYCEDDYKYCGFQYSAERCAACGHLIVDMILQAVGRAYHPRCFKCCCCRQCLDGIPFTVDQNGRVYCVHDYHKMFAPKCAACRQPITPVAGTDETVRVVSMDKDYHIDCYVCEGCGIQLTDEIGRRCFPLDGHLLCQRCHVHWARTGAQLPITDV